MKLSANFSLDEFCRSSTATRKGIDNRPPSEVVEAIRRLVVRVLQPLRDELGSPIRVNSGYRSPALNKAIGGSFKSQHLVGEAADIEVDGYANIKLAHFIATSELPFDQLILEFYDEAEGPNSGWVHVSHRVPRRGQVLTASRVDGRVGYRAGLPSLGKLADVISI